MVIARSKRLRKRQVDSFCNILLERGLELREGLEKPRLQKTNKVGCRVCGNKLHLYPIDTKEMFLGSRHQFRYLHCSQCGSLSISTIPKNIKAYYERYYTVGAPVMQEGFRRRFLIKFAFSSLPKYLKKLANSLLKKQDDFALKAVARMNINKGSKILDVGSGCGSLVMMLNELGYQNASGADPFLPVDQISEKLHQKSISEIDGVFDLVMFHHSFEHDASPRATLAQVRRLIGKNGRCLIRMPNIDSYGFRQFKAHWWGIHAPFHYVLPSQEGMELLCRDCGLKIDKVYGEQQPEFLLYSINYSLGISDFDQLGLRRFLGYDQLGSKLPPTFSKQELKFWKHKSKALEETLLTDWIVYEIRREINA